MYLLLLVVLVCSLLNICKSSDEEKYIDLLPEEEKQAFLEKVARRLVNGVTTKDSRYKSSEEISDDELNRHSAYVRQVLEEESGNIRRNVDRKGRKEKHNELEVKGIEKPSIVDDVEDVNHIDLTLRGGNRRKRDKDDDYKTVPVDTIYDNENDKRFKGSAEKSNAERKDTEGKELTGENTTAEDIQVRGHRKSRKVNESPDVEKNVISNEATQAVDDDAEDATESNQNDTEEDEAPTESDLKSNQKGFTVPIYDAEDENHEYDENEPVTDVTTTTIEETPTTQETTTQKSTTTKSTTTKSTTAKTTTVKTTTAKTTTAKTTTAKTTTSKTTPNDDKTKVHKKRYLRANDGEVDEESTTTLEKNTDDFIETSTNSVPITTEPDNDDKIHNGASENTNPISKEKDESSNESASTYINKISGTTETFTSTVDEEIKENSEVKTNKPVLEAKEAILLSQTPKHTDNPDPNDENISTTSLPEVTEDKSEVIKHLNNQNNSDKINTYEETKEDNDKYSEEKTRKPESQDDTESLTLVSQNLDKSNFDGTNTSSIVAYEISVNKTDVRPETTYKNISETGKNHEEETPTVPKQNESQDVSLNIARIGNGDSHNKKEVKEGEASKTNTSHSDNKVENSAVSNKSEENLSNLSSNNSENYESGQNVNNKREVTNDSLEKLDSKVTESNLYNSVSLVNSNNTNNRKGETTKTVSFVTFETVENVTKLSKMATKSHENNKSSSKHVKFVDTTAKPNEDHFKADFKPVEGDKEFQTQSTASTHHEDSTTNTENVSNAKDISNSNYEEKENPIVKNTLRSDERKQYVLTTTERDFVPTATPDSVTYKTYYSQNDSQIKNEKKYSKTVDDWTPDKLELKSNNVETNSKLDDNELADFVSQSFNLRNILEAIGETVESKNNQNILQKNEPPVSSQKKLKEYIVYEIPEGETPFLRKEKEKNQEKSQVKKVKENEQEEAENQNQDQPYYVPIYNYAPNNAYYNPYNRLGPNIDENQNDENVQIVTERGRDLGNSAEIASNSFEMDPKDGAKIDYESLRKFKFSGKKLSSGDLNNVAKTKAQINLPLPIVVKKPKFTEIYFNPDEYLDLDYYFGRANKQPTFRSQNDINVPATFEDMHPYNLISSHKAKDHLSAIRQMLFENGHFGYVTSSHMNDNSTEVEKDHQSNDKKNDKRHRKKKLRNKKTRYRAVNDSDLIFLYPNQNLRNQPNSYTNQQDISVDYYFGVDDNVSKKRENLENVNQNIRTGKETLKENNTVTKIKELLTKRRLKYPIDAVEFYRPPKVSSEEEAENNTSFWQKHADAIKKLLDMSDATDVFKTFEKLYELSTQNNTNKEYIRTKDDDDEINIYISVLKDMIEMDNKALHQFDWLGSTVDVLAALSKLQSLTNDVSNGISVHPSDLQLLKYVLHVYKSAKIALEESKNGLREERDKKKRKYALPRNQKKPKEYLTAKGLINRIWLYIRGRDKEESLHEINDFGVFLDDLGSSLYDLYDALKHIALVTKYKKQRWYDNLKEIYMKNTQKRYLLEVLVHVYTTRLVGLIEDSAINGLEDGYLQYVKNNTKMVERTVDEFVSVLKLLSAFKDANIQNL